MAAQCSIVKGCINQMFSVRSDKDVPVYVDMLLCVPNGSHCELRLLLSILISLSYCWEFTLLIKRVAGGDKCNEPVKKINIRVAAPISHLLLLLISLWMSETLMKHNRHSLYIKGAHKTVKFTVVT